MRPTRIRQGRRRFVPAWGCAIAATLLLPTAASAAGTVSSNWAGYAALASAGAPAPRSVSGSWRQPAATCTPGRESYSAVWVGLGGFNEGTQALEQIGSDADCTRSGHAVYSTWLELVPAAAVGLKLTVHPGDQLSASVTVRGHDVLLRIRDLSTGARISTIRRSSHIDTSSAEWIVEAPSACGARGCHTLALTDFGSVPFASATLVSGDSTVAAGAPTLATIPIELQQRAGHPVVRSSLADALITATPSPLTPADGAFSVSWSEAAAQSEAPPAPALPPLSGAPASAVPGS